MLQGQHIVKLGEKNRLAFPTSFRKELGKDLIITYGFEHSILVVSQKNWKNLLSTVEEQSFLSTASRDIKRFLIGGSTKVTCDTKGRFVIPEYLKTFANISEETVCVGVDIYAEIWNKAKWEKHTQKIQQDIEKIAEDLLKNIERK